MTAEPTFNKIVKQDAKKIDKLLKHSKTDLDCHNCIHYPDDCSIFRGRKFHPCSEFGSKARRDGKDNASHKKRVNETPDSLPAEKPVTGKSVPDDTLELKAKIKELEYELNVQIEWTAKQARLLKKQGNEIAKLKSENEALKNGIKTSLPEIRKQAIIGFENKLNIRIKEMIKICEAIRANRLDRKSKGIGLKQLNRSAVKYKGMIIGLNDALETISRVADVEKE